jgi:hypothetical protein
MKPEAMNQWRTHSLTLSGHPFSPVKHKGKFYLMLWKTLYFS